MLVPYSDWRPTPFDPRGLHGQDFPGWLVVPVIRTRDSGPLEESNFSTALSWLGGETDEESQDHAVAVLSFNHWGPGWFEVIIVRPDSPQRETAQHISDKLDDYPILDENDFSEREYVNACEVWSRCYSVRERLDLIAEHNRSNPDWPVSIFAARHECIPHDDCGYIFERLTSN